MAIDKGKAINIIIEAVHNYDFYLKNKTFMIVFKKGEEINNVEVTFRSWHFLHLTGLKSKLTAQKFYEACIDNRLSIRDISFDNVGRVEQKIRVLPYLHNLLYHNCMIGDFINSGVMIQADYFVGDTKFILSVGFRKELNCGVPVTLYNGDVRKLTNPTNRVIAVFARTYPEKVYTETTFIARDINLSEIDLPSQVRVYKRDEAD